MKKKNFLFIILSGLYLLVYTQEKKSVLIFTGARGYKHASIPDGVKAVYKIGQENNFNVDTTSDKNYFTADSLKKYATLIFISTNPVFFDSIQKANIQHYINEGGGYVGVHGASAGIASWPWFAKMVGGTFIGHPPPQNGTIILANNTHLSTTNFPHTLMWRDEWYNFDNLREDINVLLWADENSYCGGQGLKPHPLAWYGNYDGGRSFYTAIGHFPHHYTDVFFVAHLTGGILYAMGEQTQ